MIKIAFDIGGVLSKYSDIFGKLVAKLQSADDGRWAEQIFSVDVYVISDMHDVAMMHSMLQKNGFNIPMNRIFSADYDSYGEYCKTKLCEELKIDILIDDFVGYLAEGDFIRLLVMPNVRKPYYDDTWKIDGEEASFGRTRYYGDKK